MNKMILGETKNHRHYLLMMWYDYKKSFEYVPYNCILRNLELTHVAIKIIKIISAWATKLYLNFTETDLIKYIQEIYNENA